MIELKVGDYLLLYDKGLYTVEQVDEIKVFEETCVITKTGRKIRYSYAVLLHMAYLDACDENRIIIVEGVHIYTPEKL